MRIAIYIRVSTLDQAREGYSLAAQERALTHWCASNNHKTYEIYRDEGISAKDIDHRPGMMRLIDDAKSGKFDAVLFWALSRFTRSVINLYDVMTVFDQNNISMISHTEAFDTSSPMGRAIVGVCGVFAQLERELTSERVKIAMKERAMQGKRTCSCVLGYEKDGDNFTVNDSEAEYVRFVFEQYLIYKNLSEVAEKCRHYGYKGKKGRSPSPYTIRYILTNAIYCGYNTFHGILYRGKHIPIIEVDMYIRVQKLLKQQGKLYGRNPKHTQDKIKQLKQVQDLS